MKTALRATRPAHPTYLKLVKAFPLRVIRSDAELAEAQAMLDALLREHLDQGGEEYLATLTDLIEKYENDAHPMPPAAEGDVLQVLMEGRKLSQSQLARETGIAQPTISAILSGEREMTKAHVVKLAQFFDIDPTVFLPRGRRKE